MDGIFARIFEDIYTHSRFLAWHLVRDTLILKDEPSRYLSISRTSRAYDTNIRPILTPKEATGGTDPEMAGRDGGGGGGGGEAFKSGLFQSEHAAIEK